MATSEEQRKKRREIRALQREATWLQKILFGLNKAEEARDVVSELRGEEAPAPQTFEVDGKAISLDAMADALQDRVEELLETVREMRREQR
ncbi:MAG: hypothetical protein WD960_04135 [Gemmatimonadota bacterium]